jgi:hypothetical protein
MEELDKLETELAKKILSLKGKKIKQKIAS